MHSSAMMAVRAAILLVCLVVAPMFAIFGKAAPDVVKSLVQKFVGGAEKTPLPPSAETEPPIFRPGLLGSNSEVPPNLSGVENNRTRPVSAPPGGPPETSPVQTVAGQGTQSTLPRSSTGLASSGPPEVRIGRSEIQPRDGAVARVAHQSEAPGLRAGVGQTSHIGASQSAAVAGVSPSHFHDAERRLRQMGATYYLLESLGPESHQYRFFCKVAVGSGPEPTKTFVAANHDALSAMNEVVRQVESWRNQMQN